MEITKITIDINKPINEVFKFTITPPNSTLWIPSIISEETNEWPVKIGIIYKLKNNKGEISEVIVTTIIENKLVEWISKDNNYHCRYSFKSISKNITRLTYFEWVDKGEIAEPFTIEILQKLKAVIEKQNS